MGSIENAGLEAGSLVGPYRIEADLGEGGMGRVFRAVHEPDGKVVALKVIKPGLASDPLIARRFLREARAASEVSHGHLVGVIDFGDFGDLHYLAMDYIDGESLQQRLRGEGPLEVDESVRIIAEVSAGLEALHGEGLIHRDVKPANIMLDKDGSASLADFGLARGYGQPRGKGFSILTQPGQVVGTVEYLAPELIRGEPAGPASDIYSLGCVAFECLSGSPPFTGKNLFELGMAVLDEEPADPCSGRSDAPLQLSAVVLAAITKEPSQRLPTAAAFRDQLRTAIGAGSS